MPTSDIKKGPLYVDSTNNRVGVGTTSPDTNLQVNQTGTAGNNYDLGSIKIGDTVGIEVGFNNIGSGRASFTSLNNAGTTNNRISFGFGAITSGGEPTTNVMTLNQSGNVGVGGSPVQKLDVYGGNIAVTSADTYQTTVNIDNTDTGGRHFGLHSTGSNNSAGAFRIYDYDANVERLRIDSSGRVTMPYQPAFLVRRNIPGDGRASGTITDWVVTGSGSQNVGGHFSTSTGRFTAPVTGTYAFAANPGYLQTGINFNWYWQINGTNISEAVRFVGGLSSHSGATGAQFFNLTANDYVSINMGSTHHVNTTYNTFSGCLIG